MNGPLELDRRLIVPERASDTRWCRLPRFSTVAEADADAAHRGPGMKEIAIVTGVPRPPAAA